MVYDLRTEGGFREDMPVDVVAGFIQLVDVWPGDILRVRTASKEEGTIEYTGTDEWVIRDATGREVARGSRPKE